MNELRMQELLQAAFDAGEVSPFDLAAEKWGDEGEPLAAAKVAADALVTLKLAKYQDEGRTLLIPTNAGRYWALHGGYLAFLKEEPDKAAAGRGRNPESEALRTTYMALRLKTFWWSFGFSVAGFIMSIISVIIAISYGDRVMRR